MGHSSAKRSTIYPIFQKCKKVLTQKNVVRALYKNHIPDCNWAVVVKFRQYSLGSFMTNDERLFNFFISLQLQRLLLSLPKRRRLSSVPTRTRPCWGTLSSSNAPPKGEGGGAGKCPCTPAGPRWAASPSQAPMSETAAMSSSKFHCVHQIPTSSVSPDSLH